MDELSSTEFNQTAVENFLMSAVVIDDEAFYREETLDEENTSEPTNEATPTERHLDDEDPSPLDDGTDTHEETLTEPDSEPAQSSDHKLDAGIVISGFAEKEIICSVYKPAGDVSKHFNNIEKIAASADLVVLDWRINRQQGVALDILCKLIENDRVAGGRFRLIIIYTRETNLDTIRLEVLQKLLADQVIASEEDANKIENINGYPSISINNGNTNIIFVNKSSPSAQNSITFAELPDFAINQFCNITHGLLRSITLESIAAVRKNTHNLLKLFNRELDRSLIAGHYCSGKMQIDFGGFCAELVSDEIKQIIGRSNLTSRIDKFVSDLVKSGSDDDSYPNCNECLELVLAGSPSAAKSLKSKVAGCTTETLCLELAYLSAFKNHLNSMDMAAKEWAPILSLGTVLKKNEQFFICVQAKCDSVRLDPNTPRSFPMLELDQDNKGKFDLSVKDGDAYKKFSIVHTGYKISPIRFKAQDVIKAERKNNNFIFKACQSGEGEAPEEYTWMGDLKDSVAQRIIHSLAQHMSRVGLDEFEWLRLKAQGK